MVNIDLEEQAVKGVYEAIAWHTVAIDISLASQEQPDWGTGSLVKIKEKYFIVTCKHVVKPEYTDEDLRFLYRGETGFKWVDKKIIKRADLSKIGSGIDKTFARKISIKNRFYSDDLDDLAFLEVNPLSKETEDYNFFEIKNLDIKTPDINTWVYLMGFSKELSRPVTIYGDIGVFPYFGIHLIIDKKIESGEFDLERHFLLDFDATKYDIDPLGLSGCAVWSRIPSGDKLWTPNIYMVGVQNGIFRKSQVIVATRIERLFRLMDKLLESS